MFETDIAKVVVSWLRDWGWEVYQEVQFFGSNRADIVAVIKPKIWIIEVKLHHGIKVLEQAHGWIPWSHYVSVAVPYKRGFAGNSLMRKVHEMTGIGLIRVNNSDADEIIQPRMNRKADVKRLTSILTEEHKYFAEAGSNYGGYFTAFASTKKRFIKLITDCPGLTIKEIVEKLGTTHYASTTTAKIALSNYVRKGIISEVCLKREGKNIRYYPNEQS